MDTARPMCSGVETPVLLCYRKLRRGCKALIFQLVGHFKLKRVLTGGERIKRELLLDSNEERGSVLGGSQTLRVAQNRFVLSVHNLVFYRSIRLLRLLIHAEVVELRVDAHRFA